jgi:hypothetical protein
MTKLKIDGLIDAVRYARDGKIEIVRLYQRRWSAFSDLTLMPRSQLIDLLKEKKRITTGVRKPLWGNEFIIHQRILLSSGDESFIFTEGQSGDKDLLAEVPYI